MLTSASKCLTNVLSVVTMYPGRLDVYVHTDTLWHQMVDTVKVRIQTFGGGKNVQ